MIRPALSRERHWCAAYDPCVPVEAMELLENPRGVNGVRCVNFQPSVGENERPGRLTILLVEDEPFVLDATSRILASAGFEILPAVDSQEALKIYEQRNGQVDLVMTDMVLPGQTGQQLASLLREHSPELAVLVTSGYGNPEYEAESSESRTYFLPKPYSKRILVDKIERILAGHRPEGTPPYAL